MSTDPQTAEQGDRKWFFAHPDGTRIFLDVNDTVLVNAPNKGSVDDIGSALNDPARVLNVSAYPEVVEALELAKESRARRNETTDLEYEDYLDQVIGAALGSARRTGETG